MKWLVELLSGIQDLDVAVSQGFSKFQALGLFKNYVDKMKSQFLFMSMFSVKNVHVEVSRWSKKSHVVIEWPHITMSKNVNAKFWFILHYYKLTLMYLSSNVALGFLVVISIITSQNIEMKNGINRYVNFDAWHLNILHVTRPISWTSCLTFRMNLVGGFWFGLRSVLVIVVWLGFQNFLSWWSGLLYTVWEFEFFVSFTKWIVHEKKA